MFRSCPGGFDIIVDGAGQRDVAGCGGVCDCVGRCDGGGGAAVLVELSGWGLPSWFAGRVALGRLQDNMIIRATGLI